MAVCDLCGVPGMGTIVSSEQMREAVFGSGFNPFALGLAKNPFANIVDNQEMYQNWKTTIVAQDTSDWNVCSECMVVLKRHLKTAPRGTGVETTTVSTDQSVAQAASSAAEKKYEKTADGKRESMSNPDQSEKRITNWYLEPLKKYAEFSGRARRKEYWVFFLFNTIVQLVLGLLEGLLGIAPNMKMSILAVMYRFAVLVPGIAVSVRRLHDTDRSGWWLLVAPIPLIGPILLLAFMLQDGTLGENQYGENPKGLHTKTDA